MSQAVITLSPTLNQVYTFEPFAFIVLIKDAFSICAPILMAKAKAIDSIRTNLRSLFKQVTCVRSKQKTYVLKALKHVYIDQCFLYNYSGFYFTPRRIQSKIYKQSYTNRK